MRHIYHEQSAYTLRNSRETLKIYNAGICGSACNYKLRFALLCNALHLVIINISVIVYAVGHEVVVLSGKVYGAAVGKMSAVSKIHAHNGVAVLQKRVICCNICLRAGMGLNIGVLCAEQTAGALNGDVLHHINALTAAVVAVCGITLGVFVGKRGAHSQHNGLGNKILAGDKLKSALFACVLGGNGVPYLGVVVFQKFNDGVYHDKVLSIITNDIIIQHISAQINDYFFDCL